MACSRADKDTGGQDRGPVAPSPTTHRDEPSEPSEPEAVAAKDPPVPHLPRCAGELKDVLAGKALPGTPKLDAQRAWVVARNKGEPVLFVRAPAYAKTDSNAIAAYRRILERTRFPADFFRRLEERQLSPEILREIVLKEGYAYGNTIAMSDALYKSFELRDLFDAPEIWIERGSERFRATKKEWGKYYYADGPDKGERARLLNFDRVGAAGQSYGPPLHRDARTLMHQLRFDRMRVDHLTDDHVVASLRYGDVWVRTLLRSEGARLDHVCEEVRAEDEGRLREARAQMESRYHVLAALRESILAQVREELPFDEPKTEHGQEDGALFLRWQQAYDRDQLTYRHHYDRYPVFTPTGQPRVPQVCVDFLTHTLERASGTWWTPKDQPRRRLVGGIDFDELMGDSSRRRVPTFVDFAREHTELFELKEYVPSRHPYKFTKSFFRHIEKNRDDFQPGDMVFIFGLAPWDHYNVPHYHSFFVYESDPLTGMPILLASNAGKPRVRSWETEMGRAPLRGIRYRVRPSFAWLGAAFESVRRPGTPTRVPPILPTIL